MVTLRIENVPEEVRDALVREAEAKGRSLQSLLLDLVESGARRTGNRLPPRPFANRSDGPDAKDSDEVGRLIRAERTLRDERVGSDPDEAGTT